MNVCWHNDVSNNYESITETCGFEYFQKQITVAGRSQQRQSVEATEGNKVQIFRTVIALEVLRHRESLLWIPTRANRLVWGTPRWSRSHKQNRLAWGTR